MAGRGGKEIDRRYDAGENIWYASDWDRTADGNFQTSWYVESQYLGAALELTATGLASGAAATTPFTDSGLSGFSLFDLTPEAVAPGEQKVPILGFQVYSVGNSNTFSNVEFRYTGTNAFADTTQFYLYYRTFESNQSTPPATGTFDLGAATPVNVLSGEEKNQPKSGSAFLNLQATSPLTLDNNVWYQFYILADIKATAPQGNTLALEIFDKEKISFNNGKFPADGQPLGAGGATTLDARPSTALAVGAADGTYGGATTLTATLTSGGSPVSGKTVNFSLNGSPAGSATTDASGVATLSGVSLLGLNAGTHSVSASFTADATYRASSGTGTLTVARADATVTLGGLDTTYDGTAHQATASTAALGASSFTFTYNGSPTAPVNAGTYTVVATLVNVNYQGSTSGTLSIDQATPTLAIDWSGWTYDGTAHAAAATVAGVDGQPGESLEGTGLAFTYYLGADTTGTNLGGTAPKDAGTYTVRVSYAGSGNYGSVFATDTITITPRTITGSITAADRVYDGTATATLTGRTLSGVLGNEDVSYIGGTATFDDRNVGDGKTVTATGLSLSGADAGNYTVNTTAITTADVTAKALTVTGVSADNKVYDATTAATLQTGGAALVGVVGADAVTLNTAGATGTFASANVGAGLSVAVSGLALTGADAGNYSLTQPTASADITAKVLTVSGTTAASKVYDGTTAATLDTAGAALVGVVGGDTVTLNTAGASGTFATANVGASILVSVSGLGITGVQAGNYTLTQPTASADITPKALTVAGVSASDKVYDGTTTAALDTAGAALVGVVGGDVVTLDTAGASGTFATASVGSGILVSVSGLTIGGAASGNYSLTQPTASADITPKTLTVSGVVASNKVYDGTTTATLGTGSAALVGVIGADVITLDTTGATGTFATANVGASIGVAVSGLTLAGVQAGNYALTQPTTSADITPKALTVSGVSAANKVYDGTTAATLDTTGAALVGVVGGDIVTLSTAGAAGAFATADAGTSILVSVSGLAIGGASSGNYSLAQPTTSADITPKALTVTADDQTKMAGSPNPAFTFTLSGFVNGEGPGVVTGSPTLGTPTTDASPAGTYPILVLNAGTLSAANYSFPTADFVNGTLTVLPGSPTAPNVSDTLPTSLGVIFRPRAAQVGGPRKRLLLGLFGGQGRRVMQAGVRVSLRIAGNVRFANGKRVLSAVTNGDGIAFFRKLGFLKPGTFTLRATASVNGLQLPVSLKLKVRP